MITLVWKNRHCELVGHTRRGWPVLYFQDENEDVAIEPSQVQAENPDRDVKALTRSAPLVPPLFGD